MEPDNTRVPVMSKMGVFLITGDLEFSNPIQYIMLIFRLAISILS